MPRLFSTGTTVPLASVTIAGFALGYWLFGLRGAALFAATGAAATLLLRLPGRASLVARVIALLLAAVALESAATLGWGGADAPDGTRFKASPVGLSHVLTPDQAVSQTSDCGWYAASGYDQQCDVAAGGDAAFRRLRAVFPLVVLAFALSVAGALLSLRRRWRGPQRFAAGGAALATIIALALFATSVGAALAALAGLETGTGGTLGTMQATAAITLALAVAITPARERVEAGTARQRSAT